MKLKAQPNDVDGESGHRQEFSRRWIAPHSFFFLLYASIYLLPLLLVSASGYGEGLVSQTGADAGRVINQVIAVYAIGTGAFLMGSWSVPRLAWLLGATRNKRFLMAKVKSYRSDSFFLLSIVLLFLLSKIVLIPTGVYSAYAFDSDMMGMPSWTASMFLSETLAFASLMALFSERRRHILIFAAITLINAANLLHGTRNFFVTAMTGMMLYLYARTKISIAKLGLYGLVAFAAAVLLAYVVYLNRAHAGFTDFSLISVLSPITYESVFSQISLIAVLGHPNLYTGLGHVDRLVQDTVVFTAPRALVGNKEALLWSRQFDSLSPLGAFNGFALGLLYFGYLLPAAYFLLGLAAGGLQRMARTSTGSALYAYFCCDFLYRVQRDGYVIPLKMMINNVQFLLILAALHLWERRGFPLPFGTASAQAPPPGKRRGISA